MDRFGYYSFINLQKMDYGKINVFAHKKVKIKSLNLKTFPGPIWPCLA